MKQKDKQQQLISEALTLPVAERADFIHQIPDDTVRTQLLELLNDDTALTQYILQMDTPSSADHNRTTQQPLDDARLERIRIRQKLGEGGMGAVYLGFDEKLQRQVAVKTIRPEFLQVPSTQERFIREARILSRINHPAICQIYDYIETSQGDFLILEYIEGQELFKVRPGEGLAIDLLCALCEGLSAAHRHGIIHRDLKPDNIMLTSDGQVKILDFGIARSIAHTGTSRSDHDTPQSPASAIDHELTQHGSLVGTIRYMSPEQARGETLTTASDMYSLGIIAQELLSGEAAYPVMATEQLLLDVQHGRRREHAAIRPPLQSLISQLTAADPQARPDAAETAAQLRHIRQAPQRRKRRFQQALAAAALMLLLALSVWQWQRYSEQRNSQEAAESYAEAVEKLVESSRQIYVLPKHNVRPAIEQLLSQAAVLYGKISNDDSLTADDRLRLQGLIYLEAEEFKLAVQQLEQISDKAPADFSLLSRAWTGLYIDVMTEYSEQHGVAQALQENDVKSTYLEPTLRYIDMAPNSDPVEQAFRVSQTESLDQAVEMLNEILASESWNRKAIKLKSQILLARGLQALEAGEWATANSYYRETVATYERAIEMARSYPDNYYSLCSMAHLLMTDGIHRTGREVEYFADKAITACEDYLLTYPGDGYAMNDLARIHLLYAQWLMQTGQDPAEQLQLAQEWTDQAPPEHLYTHWTQAMVYSGRALLGLNRGEPVEAELEQAAQAYAKADKLLSSPLVFMEADRLFTQAVRIAHLSRQGEPIEPALQQAQQIFAAANGVEPLQAGQRRVLLLNHAAVELIYLKTRLQQGQNILPATDALIEQLETSLKTLPQEPNILIAVANAHLLAADYRWQQQLPAAGHTSRAADCIEQAMQINPRAYGTLLAQAQAASLTAAENNADFNADFKADFKAANDWYAKAHQANINSAEVHYAWARSYLRQAMLSPVEAQPAALELAQQQVRQALNIDPENPFFLQLLEPQNQLTQPRD